MKKFSLKNIFKYITISSGMEIVKAAGAILSICSVIFSVLFVNLMNSAFLYENFFIKKYFFLNNYFQWNVLITEA